MSFTVCIMSGESIAVSVKAEPMSGISNNTLIRVTDKKIEEIVLANAELPRFESMEQLKEALKVDSDVYNGIYFDSAISKETTSKLESVEQPIPITTSRT